MKRKDPVRRKLIRESIEMLDGISLEKLQARLANDQEMMILFKDYIRDLKKLGET